MKRVVCLVLILVLCLSFGGCKKEKVNAKPQVAQMRSICELATMECYYHNVAKYEKLDATGALWWEKDRKFWIEYSGVVTVGIDATLVKIDIDDSEVRIGLPPAEILGIRAVSKSEKYYKAKDTAKITSKHEDQAIEAAQNSMLLAAQNDTVLLASARDRAEKLLEDYVNNIGEAIGKKYTVTFYDIELPLEAE